ncbi:putative sulfate transport system permease protein [Candidatus Moduliflexus flocculans]|uniref:Putative sulfate transport system permease protein n=1 Tax=Candidatus Moduliflexus flocculans TaxID=1499966 RepID=A0A0S6W4L3_9BACT|nr:putative sulfate transport system permease protein [Candidatus Moduliflexus flocculans]
MRLSNGIHSLFTFAVAIFPVMFLAVFFYLPLLSMLKEGCLDPSGSLTLHYLIQTLRDPYHYHVISLTFKQACLSTIITLLIGLPGAYIATKFDFPGKAALQAITTIPFVLPSIIVSLGFILLFGNNGILNNALKWLFHLDAPPLRILYSLKAIVLAHAFYNFPVVVRFVSAVWSSIDPRLEDAARSLGASDRQVFQHVTLPLILPGILASAALTFIFSFMSFAVVLVLGGVKYATVEVTIYTLMTVLLDYKMGSALAIVQSLFSLSFMYVYAHVLDINRPTNRLSVRKVPQPKIIVTRRDVVSIRGASIMTYAVLVLLMILGPMLAVCAYSFVKHTGNTTLVSAAAYQKVFATRYNSLLGTTPLQSIRNSLFFGVMTVFCSLPLGVCIAFLLTKTTLPHKKLFDALVMLPLGISSVSLGLGYVRSFHKPPLLIAGTWYAIVCAHTILAYPFVMRAVTPLLKKMQPALIEAAMSLGATRTAAFFLIELPLIKPGLLVGATFAFAMSLGEMGTTYLLYRPVLTTMPISIYRFLSSHDFASASAMGVLLMCVCGLLFFCIERLGYSTF